MSESGKLSFGQFLGRWRITATAGAWDRFGLYSTIVGFVLWAWHKGHQASFDAAAAWVGISPDAALTDLVWQVPAIAGLVWLAVRVVRAPYEMYLHQAAEHNKQLLVLQEKADGLEADRHAHLLKAQKCAQLAQAISDYNSAINEATAVRFSEASRQRIDAEFLKIQQWLRANVGPVQEQSFVSAGPVNQVYSGLPGEFAALWQVSRGRLLVLNDIATRFCQ